MDPGAPRRSSASAPECRHRRAVSGAPVTERRSTRVPECSAPERRPCRRPMHAPDHRRPRRRRAPGWHAATPAAHCSRSAITGGVLPSPPARRCEGAGLAPPPWAVRRRAARARRSPPPAAMAPRACRGGRCRARARARAPTKFADGRGQRQQQGRRAGDDRSADHGEGRAALHEGLLGGGRCRCLHFRQPCCTSPAPCDESAREPAMNRHHRR